MKNFTIFFQICEHRIPLYLFPYSFFNVFQWFIVINVNLSHHLSQIYLLGKH
jgi:hypothetical protein